MSGGHFDYLQYHIQQIADDIQRTIEKNGKPKEEDDLLFDSDWYEKYPEYLNHHEYSPEVIEKMKEAVSLLNRAFIYVTRIDWLQSGDDGEETFLKRLEEDLGKL